MWNIISNNAVITSNITYVETCTGSGVPTPYKIHNFRYTVPGNKIVVDGTKLTDGLNICPIDPQTGVSASFIDNSTKNQYIADACDFNEPCPENIDSLISNFRGLIN